MDTFQAYCRARHESRRAKKLAHIIASNLKAMVQVGTVDDDARVTAALLKIRDEAKVMNEKLVKLVSLSFDLAKADIERRGHGGRKYREIVVCN